MSLLDTLWDVGEAVAGTFLPHGDKLVGIIRKATGDDSITVENTTGAELAKIVEGLPPETTARIHESYNAVLMNSSDNYRKMQEAFADADKSGKSKRGEIAYILSIASIIWISAILFIVGWVAYKTNTFPSEWIIAAILTFPFTVIGAYFGIKSSEIKTIMDLKSPMTGSPKESVTKALMGRMFKS